MMKLKAAILGIALMAGLALPVQAATLTGDNVTATIDDLGGFVRTESGTVGAGTDVTIGAVAFDFNLGLNGDEFSLSFIGGPWCGLLNCPGTTKVELTGLNFSGGESLVGFSLLRSVFTNVTWVTTATSIVFTFEDKPGDDQIMLYGRFLTSDQAPVPVPAALPLLASGLGALGIAGWRRRKLAKA